MGHGTPFSSAFHLFVSSVCMCRIFTILVKAFAQRKPFSEINAPVAEPTFHWSDNEVTFGCGCVSIKVSIKVSILTESFKHLV